MARITSSFRREGAIKRIYRRFASHEHAIALTRGQVWLATYENIRSADHGRQDAREGEYSWRPDVSAATTPEERTAAFIDGFRRSGTGMGVLAQNAHVEDASIEGTFNGFLLCASRRRNLTQMGDYCVKIEDPGSFMSEVLKALINRFPGTWNAFGGAVEYERDIVGEQLPNHPALLGSRGNEAEEETRLVWASETHPALEPLLLNVPPAARYCSIV